MAKGERPYDEASNRKALAKALQLVSEDRLSCYDPAYRHDWKTINDFHEYKQVQEGRRKITLIAREATCRRCDKYRREVFVLTKLGMEKIGNDYKNPEGWALEGVPRGVLPAAIVRQEAYRRALEKATGVEKGQTLASK